ncbi:lethal(2) giant larvae protein homolog 1-like isoform X2 [Littorina saxatilis]|uniref:Lethal giant larvae homologue 2 domain-containing protein n=2 Tax=Littorina saxatilis TaxID=31220 RepID=A0AAN9BUQ2_9CAEN
MFKFFKKHPPKEGEDREKLKKDLFDYQKCADHGFPSKPSAFAYDPILQLMAIGTKSGGVRVYGAPGVLFSGMHKEDVSVTNLFFLPEEGRLVSVCSDNTLHLWEINLRSGNSVLEEVKEFSMENNKMKTISTCCLTSDSQNLLLGTEGGNIHILNIPSFTLADQIIYQDIVMQNVPDDFKVSPGAVEAVAVHPTNSDKFLIGYNRGLIVLWDNKENKTEQTYNATQQLESLAWNRNGEEFFSAHADGSYITWDAKESAEPKEAPVTPYGPFPCKAINKLQWKSSKGGRFVIFSGGMPRASYGDRHTITVMQGDDNHVVFDFTSRVVDFFVLCKSDETDTTDTRSAYDEPTALMVLVEEEFVMIDLETTDWPALRLPYLHSVHSSAITCAQHVLNVPDQLWQKLIDAGDAQCKNFSTREWPITGGKNLAKEPATKDLLITGHEDGTVRFWDASGTTLRLLYRLATSPIFCIPDHAGEPANGEEEEWPPFRKVGTFDPYSDDPRLAIQKTWLCPLSETLVVAGTAGQVLVLQMEREPRTQELQAHTINIVSDRDNFVWKGHEALTPTTGDMRFAAGYQPTCIMQLYPPAACTALALHSEWQLVAAGTAHGFGLFDYAQKKQVTFRCTLNVGDMTGTSDTAMSRRKSLKKSLRESFRRLRKGRSERRRQEPPKDKTATQHIEQTATEVAQDAAAATQETATQAASAVVAQAQSAVASATGAAAAEATRPVERMVEARSADDSMASMVRSLYFADTFIVNGGTNSPSLWVGTNGGHVYVYSLTVPPSDKRSTDEVGCVLAKEIKLKHHAPVISIAVIDSKNRVLPEALEVSNERAKAPDMEGQHSVIICSEEQLKAFTLPALKPRWKNKITAVDGSRLRRVNFVSFRSKTGDNYSEFDIASLNNLGELGVYSVMSLRRQMLSPALRKEDINGIASFVFTKDGQGFYLQSPSEFCHVSLSASNASTPVAMVELKEGMRPEPQEPVVEVTPPSPIQEEGQVPGEAGEGSEAGGEVTAYDTSDITTGLNDSQANDSRVDTSAADITIDSVRDHVAENNQTTTMITTDTTVVTVTAPSPLPPDVTVENGEAEEQIPETNGPATNGTNGTDEPSSPVDEIVDKLQEAMLAAAAGDDPALLKQKLMGDAKSTITTTVQEAI